MPRRPIYKPLLFTTTLREPARIKDFLSVLYQYDGEILTNHIIQKVVIELLRTGLYTTTTATDDTKYKWKHQVELTIDEAKKAYEVSKQNHKEAGFDRGWPSRFDTWYKLPKELGLVWYWIDEKIEFSETAKLLLDKDNPQNETLVFANAFARYYRDNPFKRVLNSGIPLKLLLNTIQLLNADSEFNGSGIARSEIPLLLCWHDEDARGLYRKIKELRQQFRYSISDEIILEECHALLDPTERNNNSLLTDYPDEYVRKMRLTGLITVRGGGRFIDWNHKEQDAIEYLLSKFTPGLSHNSEYEFFNYMSQVDEQLVSKLSALIETSTTTHQELHKWAEYYGWDKVAAELNKLSTTGISNDDILKVIEKPLRLEFLTSLAITLQLPNVSVKPNYTTDDEGLPTSFAQGGEADIVCQEDGTGILVEVTMLKGTQQHIRESYSVQRHLEDYKRNHPKAFSILISPVGYIDTIRNAAYNKREKDLDVRVINIFSFIQAISIETSLDKASLNYSLKDS